jgi:uncharacterized protein (TIGR02246 family)
MPLLDHDRSAVEDVYKAMQTGPAAEGDLVALFADDGVLVEPFSGTPRAHTGRDAIRASLAPMWATRAPDLVLNLDRIDLDGDSVLASWTCTSAMMPGPMRGRDVLIVRDGKIARLEIVITEMPQFGG